MLTDEDFKRMSEYFATKQELNDLEEKLMNEFHEVNTGIANVYGEVKNMREEQSMYAQRHDDAENTIKSYGKRLDEIESIPTVAHELKLKRA